MGQITEKTIDIDSILKNKMGTKAKWVPRPLVSWLKHIAHQDQVNAFLWESRDKVGTPWLEACVDYLEMTLEVEGKENLPDPADGRLYTFVSNHPLGGEDGVALGALMTRSTVHSHQQDRQGQPQLPCYGGSWFSERQPHVNVPCRALLPPP